MKLKTALGLVLVLLVMACGTHAGKSEADMVSALDTYMVKVNENHTLGQTVIEGALTDTQGQDDIGTFKYYVNYNKDNHDLCHVKNVEETGNSREENYYYQDNKLVTVVVASSAASEKKIYINKGRTISTLNIAKAEEDMLIAKGNRFLDEYLETLK